MCIISTALEVPKRIFAVLYVSIVGLTLCYKTTDFHIYVRWGPRSDESIRRRDSDKTVMRPFVTIL